MRKLLLCALALLIATSADASRRHPAAHRPGPAAAPSPPAAAAADSGPQQLSLTVYNSSLALVQDQRRIDVPAGRTRLEFKDVSAAIKPQTVTLAGKGLSIVEQNFDYDLLTPTKMMEKAVGKQIQIVRTNPGSGAQTTETATVLSANAGVVLKVGNRIEVLRDDGIPTRVVFDSIPENLRAHPTLSVTVDAEGGGPRTATLSYLTGGLKWKADYVALFDEKDGGLKLQGWATLTNASGTSFKDAATELVAGDFNLVDDVEDYWKREDSGRSESRSPGTGGGAPRPKEDFYVYRLPEHVTIADSQNKQVSILDTMARATKTYELRVRYFDGTGGAAPADVVLKFKNQAEPLPAGVVRVYMRDETGEQEFLGEDEIEHSPTGSDMAIKIGEAFDVTVEGTVVASEKISKTMTRYSMSYVFRNARPDPVTVDLRQERLGHDGKVETESLPSKRIDAYTLGWSVPVPANGETTLTFTVDVGN
jgi:hypothetical protein